MLSITSLKCQVEAIFIPCKRCGKCCDLTIQAPFVLPKDIRGWMDKKQWNIILSLQLCESQDHEQEITFRKAEDGHCVWWRKAGCLIYKSRPITCAMYPTHGTCHHGNAPTISYSAMQQFNRARKEWMRASAQWKQDHFMDIRQYAEVQA
jgi:Fe-S-cluster containining protein